MKSLKKTRSKLRGILLILALFSLVVNVLMLTMPLYMLQIYDRILPSQSMDTLVFLSIIAGGALVVLGMLEAVRAIIASRAAAKIETILGADTLRISMIESRNGDANIQSIRDLNSVKQFVSSRVIFSLMDMPFAPLFIGVLYIIHPTLFWLTLGGAVVLLFIALTNQWVTKKPAEIAANQQSAAMSAAQSMSQNAHALRAMGMTQNAIALWGSHEAPTLSAQGSVDTRNAILSGFSRTLRMGLQIAILGVGALLVLKGEMTPGMIFASSIISGRGLQPIDQVIGGWRHITQVRRSWRNLTTALERAGDEAPKTSMPTPKGEISTEGATVLNSKGAGAPPILNRISFTLQPGNVLGVVGPSGSGKSTLARLLVGAQRTHPGITRIDGTDIQNWDPVQLGQHIGYLGQEMDLLPGTIAQNIARLASVPDDAAVLEAAQKAQVHQLIQGFPDGYDTRIGHGGMKLSGGQRQRVGLARAFYGNPQIMVLDEPNANLDEDGELALQRAIAGARQAGVTIVIITQRKQVLNSVDKIMRLHQGNVDFFGTREEFVEALKAHRAKANPRQETTKPRRQKAATSEQKTIAYQPRKKPRPNVSKPAPTDPSAPLLKRLVRAGRAENERKPTTPLSPADDLDVLNISKEASSGQKVKSAGRPKKPKKR